MYDQVEEASTSSSGGGGTGSNTMKAVQVWAEHCEKNYFRWNADNSLVGCNWVVWCGVVWCDVE